MPSLEYPVSLRNATSRNNGCAHPNIRRFHGIIISRGISYNVSDDYFMIDACIQTTDNMIDVVQLNNFISRAPYAVP